MGKDVRVRVTIRGTRPLFQHKFGDDAIPLEKGEKTGVAGNDPQEWHRTKMVAGDGTLYIDGSYVFGMMRDAGKHVGKKGSGLSGRVGATLQVEEAIILLNRKEPADVTRDPTQPVYLDVRGVRNPTTKARNIRYRLACSPGWECTFTLFWDKTVVPREVMRAVINEGSTLVGLASGRGIGMGRFEVLSWEELSGAEEETAAGDLAGDAEESVGKGRRRVRSVSAAAADNGMPH